MSSEERHIIGVIGRMHGTIVSYLRLFICILLSKSFPLFHSDISILVFAMKWVNVGDFRLS